MGLVLVKEKSELNDAAADLARRYEQEILIQEYIPGKEMSTCILGSGEDAYAYLTVEYTLPDRQDINLFTKQVKINGNHRMMLEKLNEARRQAMEEQALYIYRFMRLQDISRIDWRYELQQDRAYFIETTPLPELSEGTDSIGLPNITISPILMFFPKLFNRQLPDILV